MILTRLGTRPGLADLPVTMWDAKEQLRVTDVDEEFLIETRLRAAIEAVSEMTGRALMAGTWRLSLRRASGQICLPKPPVQALSAVSRIDRDGAEQPVMVGDFILVRSEDRTWLFPDAGKAWPADLADRPDALRIDFTAGYPMGELPEGLRAAILMLTAHLYERREVAIETALTEVPLGFQALINLYRIGWVGA